MRASANSFWLIPQRLATLVWHLWCTFIAQSGKNGANQNYTQKNTYMHLYSQTHGVMLTLTLQSLLDETPQQTPTVVAKGGTHVVVGLKAMWHVNFKTLLLKLNLHPNIQPHHCVIGMIHLNSLHTEDVSHTIVSRLLAAVPVHLPMILSIHFLWIAALHSVKTKEPKAKGIIIIIITNDSWKESVLTKILTSTLVSLLV